MTAKAWGNHYRAYLRAHNEPTEINAGDVRDWIAEQRKECPDGVDFDAWLDARFLGEAAP